SGFRTDSDVSIFCLVESLPQPSKIGPAFWARIAETAWRRRMRCAAGFSPQFQYDLESEPRGSPCAGGAELLAPLCRRLVALRKPGQTGAGPARPFQPRAPCRPTRHRLPLLSFHAPGDQMPFTYQDKALFMDWCLACHRDPRPHLRPREDVFNLAWEPPKDQPGLGDSLFERYQIQGADQLTSCSTCHR